MVRPGLINLDFADVRAVMDEMGKAMMGTGESEGEDRAIQAAEKAIANPLLDEISLKGARGVLINITGGHDLTLFELDEAANRSAKKSMWMPISLLAQRWMKQCRALCGFLWLQQGSMRLKCKMSYLLPRRNVQASVGEEPGNLKNRSKRTSNRG